MVCVTAGRDPYEVGPSRPTADRGEQEEAPPPRDPEAAPACGCGPARQAGCFGTRSGLRRHHCRLTRETRESRKR